MNSPNREAAGAMEMAAPKRGCRNAGLRQSSREAAASPRRGSKAIAQVPGDADRTVVGISTSSFTKASGRCSSVLAPDPFPRCQSAVSQRTNRVLGRTRQGGDPPNMSESNVNTPPASAASANGLGYGPIKPLAVRLNESTRTQLDIIAQLNDRTVTDEVRLAIEAWIDKTKADPAIQRRAKDVREEIEREAAGKRDAIAAIFDSRPEPKTPRTPPKTQGS